MRYHGEQYSSFSGPRFALDASRMGLAGSEGEWLKRPKEWGVNASVGESEWLRIFEGRRAGVGAGSDMVIMDGSNLEEVS